MMKAGLGRGAHHRTLPHAPVDAQVLLAGGFEVLKVLSKRLFVELGQERRLNRRVESPDVVDKLTFVHGVFTFRKRAAVACPGALSQRRFGQIEP
jgi:hypothetical protein